MKLTFFPHFLHRLSSLRPRSRWQGSQDLPILQQVWTSCLLHRNHRSLGFRCLRCRWKQHGRCFQLGEFCFRQGRVKLHVDADLSFLSISQLYNTSSITGLITWVCILGSYLVSSFRPRSPTRLPCSSRLDSFSLQRFFYGMKKQNLSREDLPYKAPFQPYASWFGFFFFIVVVSIFALSFRPSPNSSLINRAPALLSRSS